MKEQIVKRLCRTLVVCAMSLGTLVQAQTIVQGPVTNPSNGHRYLVVQASNCTQMETFAQSLGGHLATVEDVLENAWISTNLTNSGNWKLFVGLNDTAVEGTFVWADGSTSAYRNWASGEPRPEDYCLLQPGLGGKWTMVNSTYSQYGVIELSGSIKVPGDYVTIQAAVDAAYAGSTIEVMPGTYTGTVEINKPLTLKSVYGAGATTINLASTGQVRFVPGATGGTLLDGFTITGAHNVAAFTADGTGVGGRVTNCIFTGNHCPDELGGAIYIRNAFGTVTFENCTAAGNSSLLAGGAYVQADSCTAVFVNCLFTANASGIPNFHGPVESQGGTIILRNCTIAGNTQITYGVSAYGGSIPAHIQIYNSIVDRPLTAASGGGITATYSNISGGWAGAGNFSGDPKFIGGGNFALRGDSPCIDAGNVYDYSGIGGAIDLAGNPRAKNDPNVMDTGIGVPPIDIGAYEFQPLDPNCPADFNGDGFVNGDDYDAFVEHFEEGC
jgi:hypothetical protein